MHTRRPQSPSAHHDEARREKREHKTERRVLPNNSVAGIIAQLDSPAEHRRAETLQTQWAAFRLDYLRNVLRQQTKDLTRGPYLSPPQL